MFIPSLSLSRKNDREKSLFPQSVVALLIKCFMAFLRKTFVLSVVFLLRKKKKQLLLRSVFVCLYACVVYRIMVKVVL